MKFNSFKIKIIAFLSLTAYTVAYSGLITNTVLKYTLGTIGCICIPLFGLLIEEALIKTSSINKLMIKSLVVALLSALPYRYVFMTTDNPGDVHLFYSLALTSFICLASIYMYDKMKNKFQRVFCVVFITVIATFLVGLELCPHALIIMFIIHICKDKKFFEKAYYIASYVIVIAVVCFVFVKVIRLDDKNFITECYQNMTLLGCLGALPIMKNYTGEKGPSVKILSYGYYLALLIVLFLIKLAA
ncbi:MAG: hypothetical protein E7385_00210 [Ruminococcaceae bacterium]|nr:hypothetical protein [Oscillospiraceae bacterium]